MLVSAFTQPGDGVIILTPVYYPFYMATKANGRKGKGLPPGLPGQHLHHRF